MILTVPLGLLTQLSGQPQGVVSWGFWVVLYAWVPFVCYRVFDDVSPDKLIMTGAAILVAGIVADNTNLWLKQVASRPRYKYLITLDDPMSEFRNWWQMIPNLAGSNGCEEAGAIFYERK